MFINIQTNLKNDLIYYSKRNNKKKLGTINSIHVKKLHVKKNLG